MRYDEPDIPTTLKPAQRRFLKAYAEMPGYTAEAARRAKVPRRTVYNWLRQDAEFRRTFDEVKETFTDFVMHKLFQRIERGSTRAIIFYLRTFGKGRGYG